MAPPSRSVFDAIYDSSLHHPGLCWVAAPVLLWALWRARPRAGASAEAVLLWRLALLGQLLIAVDALCTGGLSPLAEGSAASSVVALLFVVLGDLRYFLLLQRFTFAAAPSVPRLLGSTLGLSLVVPALCRLVGMVVPTLYAESRRLFLTYELLALALLLFVRVVLLPRRLLALGPRLGSAGIGRWLRRLTELEAAQYALWALADVLILSGVRAGLLLRLLPNLLYYVVFIPLAYFTAPLSLRQAGRAA